MTEVRLENLSKMYPNGARGVEDLTFCVKSGELLALVGPSGCGKTTTLRLISGLETPTSGTVRLDGEVADGWPPVRRRTALMFQRPVLYPQKSVRGNLKIGWLARHSSRWWSRLLPARHSRRVDCHESIAEVASLLGLEGLLDSYPSELSGGQQQRVALGRCLIRRPRVLLLDEPLNNLDPALRTALRRDLRRVQQQLSVTTIFVTHDPLEALALGDRVAIMDGGRLVQVDRPEVVLQRPAHRFVAGFFGSPAMNLVDGEFKKRGDDLHFICCAGEVRVPVEQSGRWRSWHDLPIVLGIRPESICLQLTGSGTGLMLEVRAVETWARGTLIVAAKGPWEITLWRKEDCQIGAAADTMSPGSSIMVDLNFNECLVFDRVTGAALSARPTE